MEYSDAATAWEVVVMAGVVDIAPGCRLMVACSHRTAPD
jgi:hypothetical protein